MDCSFSQAIGDIFTWFFSKFIENQTTHPIQSTKKFTLLLCRTRLPYPKITLENEKM